MRKANLARAIEHETEGNSAAAYECYQKAVDISPLIARELIQVEKGFFEAPEWTNSPKGSDSEIDLYF